MYELWLPCWMAQLYNIKFVKSIWGKGNTLGQNSYTEILGSIGFAGLTKSKKKPLLQCQWT